MIRASIQVDIKHTLTHTHTRARAHTHCRACAMCVRMFVHIPVFVLRSLMFQHVRMLMFLLSEMTATKGTESWINSLLHRTPCVKSDL